MQTRNQPPRERYAWFCMLAYAISWAIRPPSLVLVHHPFDEPTLRNGDAEADAGVKFAHRVISQVAPLADLKSEIKPADKIACKLLVARHGQTQTECPAKIVHASAVIIQVGFVVKSPGAVAHALEIFLAYEVGSPLAPYPNLQILTQVTLLIEVLKILPVLVEYVCPDIPGIGSGKLEAETIFLG